LGIQLKFFNGSTFVEEIDVLVLEPPSTSLGTNMRLKGKTGDVAE
jgi:hypothetical protein